MQDKPSPSPHLRASAVHQVGSQHHASTRENAVLPPPLQPALRGNGAGGKRFSHSGRSLSRRFYHTKWHRCRRCALVSSALIFFALVLLCVFLPASSLTLSFEQTVSSPTPEPSTLLEDELAVPRPRLPLKGTFCGLCTEGLVVFRPAAAATSSSAVPATIEYKVCMETMEEAWLLESKAESLSTVRDCVARLYNLGLLQPPRAAIVTSNDMCATVRVTVQVLSSETEEPGVSQCSSGFVAALQVSEAQPQKVEVLVERFPSWPLPSTASQVAAAAKGVERGGSDGKKESLPAYFATAAVKDADVDCDAPPPLRVDTTEDLKEVVVRFVEGAASATEPLAPPLASDLHCPTYFLTVRLGRFGRHHNQLQEILNGISLARRANRTFVLPPFVPALYMPYMKVSPELLYGWNALRRNGRYCVLTYAEARPVLQDLRVREGLVSMERVNFAASVDVQVLLNTTEQHDRYVWGSIPRVQCEDGTFVYDADDWFSTGSRQNASGAACTASSELLARSPLEFHEASPPDAEECSGFIGPAPKEELTRWERMRKCTTAFLRAYGDGDGRRESVMASDRQPRIVVLSSITAFHLRPTLTEVTRLLALLRPSSTLTEELGRYYRLYAAQLQLPMDTDPKRTFLDVLQPYRFKNMIGIHVRHREGTCRKEAEYPSGTIIALSKARYQFDGTGESDVAAANRPLTTVARLSNDCEWNVQSLLRIYEAYASWVRSRYAQKQRRLPCFARLAPAQAQVPRSYVAFDEQVGPIGSQLQAALQDRYNPQQEERAANGYPPIFSAFYDRRSRKDLRQTYEEILASGVQSATSMQHPSSQTALSNVSTPWTRSSLVESLYPIAEQEVLALTFDFFMLSNMAVFRGNIISSVSINVCLRRWGRGLPCHGVLAGYYEMLFKGYA
ncbi:hypothetical protein JIQ42_01403 [Leishmania sp. Namibia]|uniref:hypothetical protein n=1 Tax=Leishmania sp. Namibia TaxID=2802991 RepID=UPI001B717F82|nr:hypothetical protein JIQ42_01403 [Leishmania sp. Namibia]